MAGHLSKLGVMAPCPREDEPGARFSRRMTTDGVHVTMTRLAPSSGLDFDGLTAALKSVRDGIADALGVDDRDPRVTWSYGQERAKAYGVRITVTGAASQCGP